MGKPNHRAMALRSLPVNAASPRTPGLKLQASYPSPAEQEQEMSGFNIEEPDKGVSIVQKKDAIIAELHERLEAEQARREHAEATVRSNEGEIRELKQLVVDFQSKVEIMQLKDAASSNVLATSKSSENISEVIQPDLALMAALEEMNALRKELKQKDAIIGQLRRTVAVCANKGIAPSQEESVCHHVVPQSVPVMPANFQMPPFQPMGISRSVVAVRQVVHAPCA